MPKTTPAADLEALDAKLAGLREELVGLATERRAPTQRLDAARARAIHLDAESKAGLKVDAALKQALAERDKAKAAYDDSEILDWNAREQALKSAIRIVEAKRAQAITASVVPLIAELEPEATDINEKLMDALEHVQRLCGQHQQIVARAERILHHSEWHSAQDIPSPWDEFAPLLREVEELTAKGISWPLPDMAKMPRRLLSHNAETIAAAGWANAEEMAA